MDSSQIMPKIIVAILVIIIFLIFYRIFKSIDWGVNLPQQVNIPRTNKWALPSFTSENVNKFFIIMLIIVLLISAMGLILNVTNSFQQTVLIIAFVIFVIIITSTAILNKYIVTWVPEISSCPDYFIDVSKVGDNFTLCSNPLDLGNIGKGPVSFQYGMSNCDKYNWATNSKVFWDGISNTNPCGTVTN